MYINLLRVLANFRNTDADCIEWHDETKDEYAFVRFIVCDKMEHCEYIITDLGNGQVQITESYVK